MKNKAIKITGFAFTVFVLNSCTTDSLSDLTIIQEIETLQWWDKSAQELEKIKPLFFKDFTNRHSIYE